MTRTVPATTLAGMDTDRMLAVGDEAALIGVHKSNASRARQQPDHPVNGPDSGLLFGNPRYRTAPASAVIAWWAQRGKGPGVRVGKPGPVVPDGWDARQWAALQAARRGEKPSGVMAQVLRDRRVIDSAREITDEGLALLAAHATDGDTTEEKRK